MTDTRKYYLVQTDSMRYSCYMTDAEVEETYRVYQGFVKITQIAPPLPGMPDVCNGFRPGELVDLHNMSAIKPDDTPLEIECDLPDWLCEAVDGVLVPDLDFDQLTQDIHEYVENER